MSSAITRSTMTDDSGAGVDGTILNNAWLQDIYDRLDAMFAGAGAYATFTFGGKISSSFSSASLVRHSLLNTNAGGIQTDLQIGRGTNTNDIFIGVNYLNVANAFIDNRSGGDLFFKDGGTTVLTLTAAGDLTAVRDIISGGTVRAAASGAITWTGRSALFSDADGRISFTNAAATTGVQFRFSTDARFEVRNRANSDFADIYGKNAVLSGDLNVSGIATFLSGIDVSGGIVAGGNNGQTFSGSVSALQVESGIIYGHTP